MSTTTGDPDISKEAIADIALKTYTLYFLVTAIILGVLFFAAIKKASKICCWSCMYGSKYIRNEKEDPRVPESLFRAPSILTTLQERYDKKTSIRSKTKSIISESTLDRYGTARDIEFGHQEPRVHRYLDTNTLESSKSEIKDDRYEDMPGDGTFRSSEGHNEESNYGSMPPSEEYASHQGMPSSSIELQEIAVDDYSTISNKSLTSSMISMGTLQSATSDVAPLVSMDPSGVDSTRRGRYKKNKQAPTSGTSSRTASAKSSKKTGKSYNQF